MRTLAYTYPYTDVFKVQLQFLKHQPMYVFYYLNIYSEILITRYLNMNILLNPKSGAFLVKMSVAHQISISS